MKKMPSDKVLKVHCPPKAGTARMLKIFRELRLELKKKNIEVIFDDKNSAADGILFNDMPLELLIDEARVRDNFCGISVSMAQRKKKILGLSKELIKKAAFKAVGLS